MTEICSGSIQYKKVYICDNWMRV